MSSGRRDEKNISASLTKETQLKPTEKVAVIVRKQVWD